MAILQCRHCEANINSDTRTTQCKKCGALFPFACAVCDKQLRPPFPVFEDERHLSLENEPLCSEHFLRKCPDCDNWFRADENPGFFRCADCAAAAGKSPASQTLHVPSEVDETEDFDAPPSPAVARRATGGATGGPNPNALVLAGAGCAFLALLGWMLFGPR